MGNREDDYRSVHETPRGKIRAGEGSEQGTFALRTLFPVSEEHPILGDRTDLRRGAFPPPSLRAFVQLKSRQQSIHLLVRQPVIRLYSVPANAFTEEEEEEGVEDADEGELVI